MPYIDKQMYNLNTDHMLALILFIYNYHFIVLN